MSEQDSALTRIAPPPRALYPSLVARVVFGGFVGQFGWLFVAFGMIFVWVFDAGGGLVEFLRFHGDVPTVDGRTTGYRQTNLSINDVQVYATSFSARLPDGRDVTGESFGTGRWVDQNQRVVVEYVDGDPPVARIQGMRASSGGLGMIFIFIFPVVGLVLGGFSMRHGLKVRRLMTNGVLARGTLVSTEPTNTQINNQTVMKLTFDFDVDGVTYQAVAKTHLPHSLQDEERELLVYDPRNPSDAALLDELPCQPRVGDRGEFEATRNLLPAPLYLLLPGLSTLTILRYVASLF